MKTLAQHIKECIEDVCFDGALSANDKFFLSMLQGAINTYDVFASHTKKQYTFEIKKAISGVGETEEEAWKDACQNEGVHDSDYEILDIEEMAD